MNYEAKQANRLAAKVAAHNQVNQLANEWWPKIAAVLKPWVGKKVSLVTGGKPHKLKAELDALNMPSDWAKQIIVSFDTYNAKIHFKSSVSIADDGNQNAEQTVYFGDMDGENLKHLRDNLEPFKTDYSVDAVKSARDAFKVAEKAFSDARSALYPFGEREN